MTHWNKVNFADLLIDSRDGEWGEGSAGIGLQEVELIRGTDFAELYRPDKTLPVRWVKDHLVERKQLATGDIVFEMAGGTAKQSTGRTTLITHELLEQRGHKPILCASFCRHLRFDKTKYSPAFLYHLMQSLYAAGYMAVFNVQHTGVSRFQYTTFKSKTTLTLPTLTTQKKIATILASYDALIANNQRRIAVLEKMAEEIYREWFVRLRFPGHEQVKIEKGMPQGWTSSTLNTITDLTMGSSPSSEYFNQTGNGLPFHQGVGSYGPRYPDHDTFCSISGRKAKRGDILFSVRAPVGRLNIADRELIIGRGLAAIRHKRGMNGYLLYLLKVTFASEDIIGNGSIFNSVGKDELAKLGVFEPNIALVEKFEAIVQPIDKQIEALYQANASLKTTRDALLPRLISGKLSVESLDIAFPPDAPPNAPAVAG